MKKIIILIALLASLISKAQCPAPSDLILFIPNPTSAQLSWTENGTTAAWEVTLIPDFYVGANLPENGVIVTGNSFLFTDLPPSYGCNAFFVRSSCSLTEFSPWVAVGSLGCSSNVYNYLATLSNEGFSPNTNEFQIFPNPATTNIQIKSTFSISSVRIFDALGKLIMTQTQSTDSINVENLDKGIYFIEASTEKGVVYKKLIKE